MKKMMLCFTTLIAACSTPPQTSSVPMDMKSVEAYNQRVASGNTVDANKKEQDWKLNASDNNRKRNIYIYSPYLRPTLGYYGYY